MRHSTYTCNVCGKKFAEQDLFGVLRDDIGFTKASPCTVEIHICAPCLSGLQEFPKVCGAGYEGCGGGPACDDDHK